MSSVDEFVRTSILTLPGLFRSRSDVLHHVLCMPGSGYQWRSDGTIALNSAENKLWSKEEALKDVENTVMLSPAGPLRDAVLTVMKDDIEASAEAVEQVDTRMHLRHRIEKFHVQDKENALLHYVPANVTADWRVACNEMKEEAAEAGWVF